MECSHGPQTQGVEGAYAIKTPRISALPRHHFSHTSRALLVDALSPHGHATVTPPDASLHLVHSGPLEHMQHSQGGVELVHAQSIGRFFTGTEIETRAVDDKPEAAVVHFEWCTESRNLHALDFTSAQGYSSVVNSAGIAGTLRAHTCIRADRCELTRAKWKCTSSAPKTRTTFLSAYARAPSPGWPMIRHSSSSSHTPLTDALASHAHVTPLMRRALAISNLPPDAALSHILPLVHTGPLESVRLTPRGAELAFLEGHSAARFAASAPVLGGHALACTWLPYRPLHPVVASAVERDRARRTLVLYKAHERLDCWAEQQLRAYFGAVEELTVRAVDDNPAYSEVALVYFVDIASAIRAHERIRADPAMARVHVAYAADPCELPADTPPLALAALDAALETEPRHAPTYFPDSPLRPFTTLALTNLHPATQLEDLCQRIYGGDLFSVELRAGEAEVVFFRAEDARDFYVGVYARGLSLRGRAVEVQPLPERVQAPREGTYTRVLRVRAFPHAHEPAPTVGQLRKDFGDFGELESVNVHPKKPHFMYVTFARADDALRALRLVAVAHPMYLACNIRFDRDRCARAGPLGVWEGVGREIQEEVGVESAVGQEGAEAEEEEREVGQEREEEGRVEGRRPTWVEEEEAHAVTWTEAGEPREEEWVEEQEEEPETETWFWDDGRVVPPSPELKRRKPKWREPARWVPPTRGVPRKRKPPRLTVVALTQARHRERGDGADEAEAVEGPGWRPLPQWGPAA
ncbi:hypothetical protein DFH09DRAFT_1284255 [Mycena vulgaris]|nr:hypothetical protein DFH09DRAFT_1284255 [Mycena vulgaris]